MTSASAVLSLAGRLETLLLSDGAPARVEGDSRDGAENLRSHLVSSASYLEEEEMKNSRSSTLRQEIKELAYDVEDAFESYAYLRQRGVGEGKIITFIKYCCCLTKKSLRQDLRIFPKRIDGLLDLLRTAAAAGDRPINSSAFPSIPQYGCSTIVYSMGEDKMKLTSLLEQPPSDLSVVTICGIGGIGKTTLADCVYRDVKHDFDICAWVSIISHEFRTREILKSLLLCIAERKYEVGEGTKTVEIIEKVYKALFGRRYLIVLDGVWSGEAWGSLTYALPDNHNGSRIVITSRDMRVGQPFRRTFMLQKQKLTDEQSLDMLMRITGLAVHRGMQANPGIENIANQIVEYCGGLPIVVKVIGSILKGLNLEHWQVILHELQQSQSSESSDIRGPLKLGYTRLPSYLKPCFLYLGHFPPDESISVEKLYLLWMAEGLISPRAQSNRTRMEVAENYFNELVLRSMVIEVEKEEVSEPTRFKSFRLHDLIRDLCISEGKQNAFFEIIDSGNENKISPSTRRIAVYLNKCNENTKEVFSNLTKANHIRSILFFDTKESLLPEPTWPIGFSDLNKFQKARVLEFNGVDFQRKELPRGIEKLIYLRHLSFEGCYLLELSPSLCNLFFLETLDLRVRASCTITLPNVLNQLSSLRCLYLPLSFRSNTKDKLKLDRLKKLEILENFHAGKCDAIDLLQLENLQTLTATVDANNMDLKNTVSGINMQGFLRYSSLMVKNFDSYSEEAISAVATLLESNRVHAVHIEGYLGKFPRHEGIGSNFTEMVFNRSEFEDDPIAILGKLPNLLKLVLCTYAFVGKEMVCSELSFPKLKSLRLASLQYLEKLTMHGGSRQSMPSLEVLTIEECPKLETLPSELTHISTLKKIMMGSMAEVFQKKVEEMFKGRTEVKAFSSSQCCSLKQGKKVPRKIKKIKKVY